MKQKMLFTIIWMLALVIFSTLIGCSQRTQKGVYAQGENYLELKSNGTFYLSEQSKNITGKYEIEDGGLTLIFEGVNATRGQINGDTIIDKYGARWILWHGGTNGIAYEHEISKLRSIQANKDGVTSTLINLVAYAYMHKIRPTALGGGGGSYSGYSIRTDRKEDNNGVYTLLSANKTSVVIIGTSKVNAAWVATCTGDSIGKTSFTYSEW
jgi:hypothetical protein